MSTSDPDRQPASAILRICGLYQPQELLSQTVTTDIWAVVDDDGHKYAAKLTKLDQNGNSRTSFLTEYSVFLTLTSGQISHDRRLNVATPHGFPNIYFVGRHGNEYDVIVMELLSPDLYSLRSQNRWSANLTTRGYLMLASDMIFAVMALHQHGFVHRNVKPHNFRIADGFCPFLLGFSLAKRYIDPITSYHYPPGREQSFIGTLKYASLYAHRFKIQSRRDDLISLGYSIIDIMKRGLPWDIVSGGPHTFDEMASTIKDAKANISLSELCHGLPGGILLYMQTVYSMPYNSIPDYNSLQVMMRTSE